MAAYCSYKPERMWYLFQSPEYSRQMQTLKKMYPGNSLKSLDKQLACVWTHFPRALARFYQNPAGQFLANKCTPTSSTFDNLPSCPDSNNIILCFGRFSIEQKKIEMLCFQSTSISYCSLNLSLFSYFQQPFFVKRLSFFGLIVHLFYSSIKKANEDI